MSDVEILRLSRQGLTTGGIAKHLGLSPSYVRSVVSTDLTGCEIKPLYNPSSDQEPVTAARRITRRAAAEEKRARALRELQEAEAMLTNLRRPTL
jgi:hypothetical protein